jgi:putative ABC transport system substrate-binding protein
VQATEDAARALAVRLQVLDVRHPGDIDRAFQAAKKERAEALNVLASPLLAAQTRAIVALAATSRLPVIYQWRESPEAGGLISYGVILSEMWRQTALMVAKILKGARPADLPAEQPTRFELVINRKTARALGLTIPQLLLLRADHMIE